LPHVLTKRRAGCEIRCAVCACCEIPVAGDVCDTLGKAKYSGDHGGEGRLREPDERKADCEYRSRCFAHAKVLLRSESVG
jgi:hypothetical protein